jgi:hypothetical protein
VVTSFWGRGAALERHGADRELAEQDLLVAKRPTVAASGPHVSRWSRWLVVTLLVSSAIVGGLSVHYRLSPQLVPVEGARVLMVPVLGLLRDADARATQELLRRYWGGDTGLLERNALESWRSLAAHEPGFRLLDAGGAGSLPVAVPFVYESAGAPYLRDLVDTYALRDVIAGAPDEYETMLRLGGWVGRLFDHGADALGRRQEYIPPSEVIRAGADGKRFWCEVAARLTVHAATALGWQARLVTASRTGYLWEHAVAELWSNQHRKWFVLDTDFNVVYEVDGVPQSAFELCKNGVALQQRGRLRIRAVAPPKPSLPTVDLLPFYAYVHVDLRNDWNSRHLRPGSPAGGDLSTWWTSRQGFGPVLTAKTRVDRQDTFDWPVNAVSMYALDAAGERGDTRTLRVGLVGYSPVFRAFQTAFDSGPWVESPTGEIRVPLSAGPHVLKARVVTASGSTGPEYAVSFDVAPRSR